MREDFCIDSYLSSHHGLTAELRALDDRTKHGTVGLVWTPKAESAFKALRASLISAPILIFPDFTKVFGISVDASGKHAARCSAVAIRIWWY